MGIQQIPTRYNISRQQSTKAERRVYEVLKQLHVPFKHRWVINGREIDFLIGRYAIEIDGHNQDSSKNQMLLEQGYIPIHIPNESTKNREGLYEILFKICQEIKAQTSS